MSDTENQPTYKVGDIVNGHVLTEQNTWEPVPAPIVEAKPKKKWYLRKLVLIPAIVLVFIIIIGSINKPAKSDEPVKDAAVAEEVEATKAPAKPKPAPVEKVVVPETAGMTTADATAALTAAGFTVLPPQLDGYIDTVTSTSPAVGQSADKGSGITIHLTEKPKLSVAQENALRQAQSYLDYSDFSRQGLIDQMTSEYGSGYDLETATWAVDNVGADWNAEAVGAATSYMKYSSFSRDGLYEQMTSQYGGQFTDAEANAGLAAVGY